MDYKNRRTPPNSAPPSTGRFHPPGGAKSRSHADRRLKQLGFTLAFQHLLRQLTLVKPGKYQDSHQ